MKILISEKAKKDLRQIERERVIVVRVIDGRMDVDEEFQR